MSEQTYVPLKEIVKGVTASKLQDIGIEYVEDLATWHNIELSQDANVGEDTADKYIQLSFDELRQRGIMRPELMKASQVLEWRNKLDRCITGSNSLDSLFNDGYEHTGIETSAVTEFFGEFGSGKSQICHTLACLAQNSIEEKGLGAGCLYIDTEGTFRPERMKQIARARNLDVDKIMDNTLAIRIQNASELELKMKKLPFYIREANARLLIVDSITSKHREESSDRGHLAPRQQRLNSIMHRLVKTAEIFNIAVVITNQVMADPGQMFGDPIKPVGGNVIAHASTYRIYIRKTGRNRIARMYDSPNHAAEERKFTITEKGIEDVEEK